MGEGFPVTVYYEDTDMGGVVYHANYLKFIERARSAWIRALGLDQNALRAQDLVFVVTDLTAKFRRPARLDDALTVQTRCTSASGARMGLAQSVWRGEELLFEAEVTLAAMSLAGRPRRLPDLLLAQVS